MQSWIFVKLMRRASVRSYANGWQVARGQSFFLKSNLPPPGKVFGDIREFAMRRGSSPISRIFARPVRGSLTPFMPWIMQHERAALYVGLLIQMNNATRVGSRRKRTIKIDCSLPPLPLEIDSPNEKNAPWLEISSSSSASVVCKKELSESMSENKVYLVCIIFHRDFIYLYIYNGVFLTSCVVRRERFVSKLQYFLSFEAEQIINLLIILNNFYPVMSYRHHRVHELLYTESLVMVRSRQRKWSRDWNHQNGRKEKKRTCLQFSIYIL